VFKKGVQIGATETLVTSRACHFVDTWRKDVLCLFPTGGVASEYSSGRFDPILLRSPQLRSLFTDLDSVTHKRAGEANLYFRGSNSEAQLISIPVSLLIVDEFDRMDLNNLGLARDRLQGQKRYFEFDISTPTHPGLGIDEQFALTDQRRFLIECPSCKSWLPLSWSSVEFREADADAARWRCSGCGMPWGEADKLILQSQGRWVASAPQAKIHGYHLPSLYSPERTAADFARRFIECQANETQLQVFHNSVLGEAYSPEGTRITDDLITAAVVRGGGYRQPAAGDSSAFGVSMGVDVGGRQHVVIGQMQENGHLKILRMVSNPTIRSLMELVDRYQVTSLVIDANPERQMAREFQIELNARRYKMAWLAFYPEMKGPVRWNHAQGTVDLHRTEALDSVVGRFRNGTIELPVDTPEEFRLHLRAIVRVNEIDTRTGNAVGRWRESGPDHFAHALVYCEAAALRAGTADSRLGIF